MNEGGAIPTSVSWDVLHSACHWHKAGSGGGVQ